MGDDRENFIVNRTSYFALEGINYSENFRSLHKYEMASQLSRSGASIGLMFGNRKMLKVLQVSFKNLRLPRKEADETNYWFRLCKASSHYPDPHLRTFVEVEYK